MIKKYAKVEGHPNLLRDLSTNAIVNPLDNYYFVHLLFLNYMQLSSHFNPVKDAFTSGVLE